MLQRWKWHFRASRFQNFLGEHAPRPPKNQGAARLSQPPTFPESAAYFKTFWNPCFGWQLSIAYLFGSARRQESFVLHCQDFSFPSTLILAPSNPSSLHAILSLRPEWCAHPSLITKDSNRIWYYGKKLCFLCKIFSLFLPCNMASMQNLYYTKINVPV